MFDAHPEKSNVSCKELFDCGKMSQGRSILVGLRVSDLLIEEPGAECFIEEEQSISELLKQAIDMMSTLIWVDLSEDLSADQSDCVDELEVLVLSTDSFNVFLLFIG